MLENKKCKDIPLSFPRLPSREVQHPHARSASLLPKVDGLRAVE